MDILSQELLAAFLTYNRARDILTYKEADVDLFVSPRSATRWNLAHAGCDVNVDKIRFQSKTVKYFMAHAVMSGKIETFSILDKISTELTCNIKLPNADLASSIVALGTGVEAGYLRVRQVASLLTMAGVESREAEGWAQMLDNMMRNNIWVRYDHASLEDNRNNHYPFHLLNTTDGFFFVADEDLPASGRASIISSARSAGVRVSTRHTEHEGIMGIMVTQKKESTA